jgi:hypothetical protein
MMKKLLLILLCLPMIGFGQLTYVPDDNFEAYLENNGMGNGILNDDYVTTANINTVISLGVAYESIADLTGIEAFTALTSLDCPNNQLTILDVSNNTALTQICCRDNQLTSINVSACTALDNLYCENNNLTILDVSNNTALTTLGCGNNQLTTLNLTQNIALLGLFCDTNQLTSINVSDNTALWYLSCNENQLTTLDLSNNSHLIQLMCQDNLLNSLDVRNGDEYLSLVYFNSERNPTLTCINVDSISFSTGNWTAIDPQHYFSTNCSGTSIQEQTTNKELLKVTDLLGREAKDTKNEILFYIHDDGTVEKRIVIE